MLIITLIRPKTIMIIMIKMMIMVIKHLLV